MTLAPSSPICSPAWATTRNPSRRTDGAEAAATARVLGVPFIPWQRHAADVLGELDARGRYHYLVGVVIVPRRAGKTHVALCRALTTTRRRPRSRAFYASHRRETAAALWRDQWFPDVELSPLHPRHLALRRSNGSEAFTWRHNRSTFRLLPPDGDAMRSLKADQANIDEGREFSLEAGLEFEAACLPTQRTGLGGQTIIWSNAGTAASTWLARWRDLGRAATANPDSRIAYIEYAAPDGADPDDDATLLAAHPGIGHHVDLDAIRADREIMPPDVFGAEYLGWWPETLVDTVLVDAWLAGFADVALADPVVFALEVDEDRTTASIVAAGTGPDGRVVVELVDHRPHGPWVGPRLVELAERWSPMAVVWDAGGPAGALAPELVEVPTRLVPYRTAEVTAAAGWFYDRVVYTADVMHRADVDLDGAIAAGRRRRAGGAWLFDRRQPGACPLIAATMAVWAHRDATLGRPSVT